MVWCSGRWPRVSRKPAKFAKDKKVKGKLSKARGLPISLALALFLALFLALSVSLAPCLVHRSPGVDLFLPGILNAALPFMKKPVLATLVLLLALNGLAQTDSALNNAPDSMINAQLRLTNKYGDLLDDDPAYTPRRPWPVVSARVLAANVFNWALAKYVYKFDWPSSGPKDWKRNFQLGPHWDADRFSINFIGHPHTGSYYYNIARSNGYSYWGSLPFAIQGSLTWEFLGENEQPSWNDMINTPISGLFLGEVFYRVSSNILDDRKRGAERVFRELLAAAINPTRAINRLTQGAMFRVTNKEVYQKEPMNITVSAGVHKVNDQGERRNRFGSGATNAMLNVQFDYGDPFEVRKRKPFDVFRFRIEMSYGADSNLLDNINGYGILAGKTIKENRLLTGIFQHFDYWRNNNIFEMGSLGFGPGLISRIPVAKHSNIYSNVHLAVMPLAGNNNRYGPVGTDVRDYNFGGGLEAKVEETFNLNRWATIGVTGYYYWIHTYNGLPGNSIVGVVRPNLSVRIAGGLRLGLEHHIYTNDRYSKLGDVHLVRTEQKLFLQWLFEDRQRSGLYH